MAGGLGRAFGIDPVLIRVVFVVMTIFGGFGGLLYVLGWLLLPSDGDEVSAAEALLGRGRSSVPPVLAVGLGVVAVISLFSMFSWGLPFLPLAVGGAIVLTAMRKRGRFGGHQGQRLRHWNGEWPVDGYGRRQHRNGCASRRPDGAGWGGWGGTGWGGSGWGGSSGTGGGGDGWGGSRTRSAGSSPFEKPAFWEQPSPGSRVDGPPPAGGVNMTKSPAPDDPGIPGDEVPRTTPPAWDPLGVAPFAWDLPEPTPLAPPSAPAARAGAGVIGRVALGATLLAGGLGAVGVLAGWWALTWAQVSGIALGVLGLGLLVSALRGRGYSLIGPGVFLSLVTLALAVTGVSGTSGYGATEIQPAVLADLRDAYSANAGQLTLDLSQITIPAGKTQQLAVDLKGGHAEVVVPAGMNVQATCETGAGRIDCLDSTAEGLKQVATGSQPGTPGSGELLLRVRVNAGYAEVSSDD